MREEIGSDAPVVVSVFCQPSNEELSSKEALKDALSNRDFVSPPSRLDEDIPLVRNAD